MNNFDCLSARGTAVSVVSFATIIWSHHTMRSPSNGECMVLCDKTKQL